MDVLIQFVEPMLEAGDRGEVWGLDIGEVRAWAIALDEAEPAARPHRVRKSRCFIECEGGFFPEAETMQVRVIGDTGRNGRFSGRNKNSICHSKRFWKAL